MYIDINWEAALYCCLIFRDIKRKQLTEVIYEGEYEYHKILYC